MNWHEYIRDWAPGWTDLLNTTLAQHRSSIEENPQKYTKHVQNMMRELDLARHNLLMVTGKLGHPAVTEQDKREVQELTHRFNVLAAGVFAHVTAKSGDPEVSGVPLVIGGLVFGVVAIAWSVAAYEYASYLSNDTMLKDKELDARILASEEGRSLAPSTLPAPTGNTDSKTATWLPWISLGGLGLATALGLFFSLSKGK